MRFTYKFTNLLGTVYHKGNLLFTPDGQTLISPVGNRITFYDLKSNKSETLPIESRYNFTTLALDPKGITLIAVNEPGEALICSLISRRVINRFHFKRPIRDVKFSPNGKYIAVTKENNVFVYLAPKSCTKQYNPFVLEKVFHFSYDETVCLDWTSDSRILAVGGKDMTTKIYAVEKLKNFSVCTLGSHTDSVVGVFFEDKSLDMYTVSKNGILCVWDCNVDLESLVPVDSEEAEEKNDENSEGEDDVGVPKEKRRKTEESSERTYYKRIGRHFIKDVLKKEGDSYLSLTAADYQRNTHIFVAGFSNGAFLLYEMPDCNLIHSLSISSLGIQSVIFNSSGDWIAFGCPGVGQLIVWEWQSETFVLKQQGHFNNMHCLCYSPEGMYIATGGEDGRVKVWDTTTGFCFFTFSEHTSSVTAVTFIQSGKAVISASLDGTARAYDLKRYRNFRTFVTPKEGTQLSCLTADPSGEIVCAGSQLDFEIFVWGMRKGDLLAVLAGHEAPVSGISFSPSEAVLISTSWDKTVRIWDVFENKGSRETINLTSSGLEIAYKPDGNEFAVTTLDGQISFFDVHTAVQLGTIEGRNDLYVGRRETDEVTAKKLMKSQAFNTLCYSADGEYVLAAGVSKYICIYHSAFYALVKRFEVTCNLSFDAVEDFINRRRITDFGNKALIEERMDEEVDAIATPGTKKLDKSTRTFKPQIKVSSVKFSPTGRAWAATTTEGLLIYSFDPDLIFAPLDASVDITPDTIREELHKKDYSNALMKSLGLNEQKIIVEVLESIPADYVENVVFCLPVLYAERLLKFISGQVNRRRHLEFYLLWIEHLLMIHGTKLKNKSLALTPDLTDMERQLLQCGKPFVKMFNEVINDLSYTSVMGKIYEQKAEEETEDNMLMNNEDKDDCHLSSDESVAMES